MFITRSRREEIVKEAECTLAVSGLQPGVSLGTEKGRLESMGSVAEVRSLSLSLLTYFNVC